VVEFVTKHCGSESNVARTSLHTIELNALVFPGQVEPTCSLGIENLLSARSQRTLLSIFYTNPRALFSEKYHGGAQQQMSS
jgi:hypothetical protein